MKPSLSFSSFRFLGVKYVLALRASLVLVLGLGACNPEPDVGDDLCDEIECSGHGICEVRDEVAICICELGYEVDGLECVEEGVGCTAVSCSGVGTCDDTTGELICTCPTGYTGDECELCDEGYHPEGGGSGGFGECLPDEIVDPCETDDPCEAEPCGDHGDCACQNGAAVCTCHEGYNGTYCDRCDQGYVERDGECALCNEVTFTYVDAVAGSVVLTGDWLSGGGDWPSTTEGGALAMVNDGAGNWSLTTIINEDFYTYKFVVDGTSWIHDPSCESREGCGPVDDGYNGFNCLCDLPCDDPVVETLEPNWRDVVLYFVMVDRFFDSDGERDPVAGVTDGPSDGPSGQYMGGDLNGVVAKMGYLNDLGVTGIWLSAPYDNRDTAGAGIEADDDHMYSAYHGYWPSPEATDYASNPTDPTPRPQVESRIAVSDDPETELRDLIDAAHGELSALGGEAGIRILFDYVMNHVDIESGLYQAHPDWFFEEDENFILCPPDRWNDDYYGTRCAFTDYLPPFDFHEKPEALAWSVADALWWAREFGVDGYRLDAIKHVPLEWLRELRTVFNDSYDEPWGGRFYMVGETFEYESSAVIRDFVDPATMLDGQFDFPFKARLCESVFSGSAGLDGFSTWMDDNDGFYGADAIMTTWIGNHDIPRAIHFANRDITNCRQGSNLDNGWARETYPDAWVQPTDAAPYERLGVAFAIMMTNPGIPLIYYGDEIGLAGGGDPDNRRMMIFEESDLNSHQLALRDDVVAALGYIRAQHRVLTRGTRTTLSVSADTWVYRMDGVEGEQPITVAINRADTSQSIEIPTSDYRDLIAENHHSGGSIDLDPRSFLILLAEGE